MSAFVLKIIACATMFIDHLSYAVYGSSSWMNIIGRVAFPIFAYQISQGYAHTRNFEKYALRLAVFAVVSQYPFMLLQSMISSTPTLKLNIFFTLFIGLMAIALYDRSPCKPAALIAIVAGSQIADLLNTDYGAWGVLLIFALYLAGNNKLKTALMFLLMFLIKYSNTLISSSYALSKLYAVGFLVALIFILLYNGVQGRKLKYFMYAFYPVHLLLLYLLHLLV